MGGPWSPDTAVAAPAAAIGRALCLLAGVVGLTILAWLIPLLDRASTGFVLTALDDQRIVARIPAWLVAAAGLGAALGGAGLVLALLCDQRLRAALGWARQWAGNHRLATGLLVAAVVFGAFDIYELFYDPFSKVWGRFTFRLREDVQAWLLLGAAVCGALALSALWPGLRGLGAAAGRLSAALGRRRRALLWLTAGGVPLVLGAVMNRAALDGIPHFADSLTYLMQGRMLQQGQLALDKPAHPELFIGSLFFVTDQQHTDPATGQVVYDGTRFFGKYPVGWPAILALFDAPGLGFLANAVMAGLAAVLTGLLARQFASRRVAVLAALLMGLSPWVWFNGANFASHTASTCALLGFLWLFLRAVNASTAAGGAHGAARRSGGLSVRLAGLSLGLAVLIRPFDAAMFALPVALVTLWLMVRRPSSWLVLGIGLATAAAMGAAILLWTYSQTTGNAFLSPYKLEGRWDKDWNPAPLAMAARLAFQWAELNARMPGWGIGGVTVAVLGGIVWLTRRGRLTPGRQPAATAAVSVPAADRRALGLCLVVACAGLYFAGSCAFGFTNVWWGPRWLMPVAPVVAILGAVVVEAALRAAGRDGPRAAAGQLALCLLAAGLLVGGARYLAQFHQHRVMPPHRVSPALHQAVLAQGLRNAVVWVEDGKRAPVDPRAGLVFLRLPLKDNAVIYVRQPFGEPREAWRFKALATWPDRRQYEARAKANATGFEIVEVGPGN